MFLSLYLVGSLLTEEEYDDDDEDFQLLEELDGKPTVTFIPFPFTEHLVQPPPCERGSPEWAAFEKISKDTKLKEKMKSHLVSFVWDVLSQPLCVSSFGRPVRSQQWLHLSITTVPAPEWVQKGIAIIDGDIAWAAKQPVDPHVISMLHKVLWPAPLAAAVWKYARTVVGDVYGRFTGQSSPPEMSIRPYGRIIAPSPAEWRRILDAAALSGRRQIPGSTTANSAINRPKDTSLPPSSAPTHENATPVTPTTPTTPATTAMSDRKTAPSSNVSEPDKRASATVTEKRLHPVRWPAVFLQELSPVAWGQFVADIRSIWRRDVRSPPRGCVKIHGVMHMETTTSFVLMDVLGYWDPKVEKIDPWSTNVNLREVTRKTAPFPRT
ncbi:uncharacterized protein DNG_05169 [Cephalotrichum gorgonifer]|uniref:Uncharacterized protein n=1 Tax=Cephalotrichum gorgonifer TaxID=2041049 RepID=A0AAE8MXC4_9PEZI|nr:uncharacterized protein DNG_05169 [Cephalotrichum gorgonifer]